MCPYRHFRICDCQLPIVTTIRMSDEVSTIRVSDEVSTIRVSEWNKEASLVPTRSP